MRPRDIISFVNDCINTAEGLTDISVTIIRKAEVIYAQKRRDALLQEWYSAFPSLNRVLDLFTGLNKVSSSFKELQGSPVEDFALGLSAEQKLGHDPLFDVCFTFVQGKGVSELRVIAEAASVAYRVGALGVKVRSGDPILYSRINEPLIAATVLGPETRTRVHPMLHGAYRLQDSGRT